MKTISFYTQDDSQLERTIRNILSQRRFIFPTNETEFDELVAQLQEDSSKLPKELDDVSRIFKESDKKYARKNRASAQVEEYALAARSGGNISVEQIERILKKIKSDSTENTESK